VGVGTGVGCGAGVRIGCGAGGVCGTPVDVAVARPVEAGVELRVGVKVALRLADEPGDVVEFEISTLGLRLDSTLPPEPGEAVTCRPPMSAGLLEGAG
jgi:hypothetical protein